MSNEEKGPTLADPRPQDFTPMGESFGQVPPSNMPVPSDGSTNISVHGSIITAQRVAVPRDHKALLQKLQTLSGMMGRQYVYSWEVKEKSGRRTTIEGATIKLANDLAREYGNCIVDVRVQDFPGYWLFYARFVDLETGFSMTRSFQQRKSQNTGMKDQDRAADIVFQIGQSKAIRNVVVNSLSTYVEYMLEEAKKNLLEWVGNNAEKANTYIDGVADRFNIAMPRIESTVGRSRSKWTVRDIAKVLTECRGISENMTVAEDVFPPIEGKAKADEPETEKPKAAPKKAAAKKPAPKKEAKEPEPAAQEPEPAPETEPEPAPAAEPEPEKPAAAPEPKAAPEEPEPEEESEDQTVWDFEG